RGLRKRRGGGSRCDETHIRHLRLQSWRTSGRPLSLYKLRRAVRRMRRIVLTLGGGCEYRSAWRGLDSATGAPSMGEGPGSCAREFEFRASAHDGAQGQFGKTYLPFG